MKSASKRFVRNIPLLGILLAAAYANASTYQYRVALAGAHPTTIVSPAWAVSGTPSTTFANPAGVGNFASPNLTIPVRNTGTGIGSLTVPSFTGTNAGEFSATTDCVSVAPNATCSVTVQFQPGALGTRSASLQIGSGSALNFSGTGAVSDPYFSSVALLMHMDGANGSNSFVDQKGHTVTAVGSAVTTSSTSVFGGSSAMISGGGNTASLTSGQSVTVGSSGPFTIEGWVKVPASGRNAIMGEPYGNAYYTAWGFGVFDGTLGAGGASGAVKGLGFVLSPINGYGGNVVYGGVYPALNTWTHFAIVRDASNNWAFFVNGVKGTTANDNANATTNSKFPANNGPTGALSIPLVFGNFDGYVTGGNSSSMASGFNGYLDELRITDGVARYTTNFTPPVAAFPNQ